MIDRIDLIYSAVRYFFMLTEMRSELTKNVCERTAGRLKLRKSRQNWVQCGVCCLAGELIVGAS